MKKLFAIVAVMGVLTFGSTQLDCIFHEFGCYRFGYRSCILY